MIEEQAQVVAIDNASVWVEARPQSACSRCAAGKGCGSAVLQSVFGQKKNVLAVEKYQNDEPLELSVGDEVVIGIEETTLVRSSFSVYAVPIITIIVFAGLGETFLNEILSISRDVAGIAGALTGFVISVVGLRWYNKLAGSKGHNQPVILRRVGRSISQAEIKILG